MVDITRNHPYQSQVDQNLMWQFIGVSYKQDLLALYPWNSRGARLFTRISAASLTPPPQFLHSDSDTCCMLNTSPDSRKLRPDTHMRQQLLLSSLSSLVVLNESLSFGAKIWKGGVALQQGKQPFLDRFTWFKRHFYRISEGIIASGTKNLWPFSHISLLTHCT